MIITLVFLALFVVVGAIYYIVGDSVDQSMMARNLDLSFDGLFKALGIITVCTGLVSIIPNQSPLSVTSAQALTENQAVSQTTETESVDLAVEDAKVAEIEVAETSVPENVESESIYQDGIYQGEGKGFKGYITMEVEVESGEITRVEVVDHQDDRKWFNRANGVVPQSIIDAQSTDVDTVSGATYTSLGMIDGAQEALSKSRGE